MKFKDKKIAILGYGIEGRDAADYLHKCGAHITVYDRRNIEDELTVDEKNYYKFILGEDYLSNGLDGYDILVRSPGVYRFISEITKAESRGVILTSPVKIFFDECVGQIIGITGTKGKGTTATLIYEILKESGKDVYLAGNIGKPVLELLDTVTADSTIVLELSSFQLIDLHKSPNVAVVLNITTDHLDWHKNREDYVEAKKNIVKHQSENDFAVINYDYEDSKMFSKLGASRKYYFSSNHIVNGCFVKDEVIKVAMQGKKEFEVGNVDELILRGKHNWENVCASVCASYIAGADVSSIKQKVFSFKGLEHRLEFVREHNFIKYYNDSFGTGPETAIAAVKSFVEPLTIILGGFEKNLDYTSLAKFLSERKDTNVVLIGDIGNRIGRDLVKYNFKGKILDLGKSSMDVIVSKATQITPKKGVIILSPATSSFDMFDSYKDRGNKFKTSVLNID